MTNPADRAAVKIAPPVLLLVHIFAAFILNWLLPLPFVFPGFLIWIGDAFILAGLALPFSAVNQLRKAHTTLDPHSPVTEIVTSGPYRFSRNPIYLGFLCLLIGFPLIFRSYWGLILSPVFMVLLYELVIKHEEAYLENKFGEIYTAYKARVRRWL
ncbi:MAG TPA: isoprenylcysteine carboxylmethyltransferase family protein [Anaerolineales bacterium]|nr:isoprenylcysteine carboxylmethyltransferase family protein [Anaerolineales bacterium]